MYDGKERWKEEMALIRRSRLRLSRHCRKRVNQREIELEDVKIILQSGEIIQGHARGRYGNNHDPVRVVMGRGRDGRVLHLVVALRGSVEVLVTAYKPDPRIWESDCRTLKKPER